MTGQPQPGNDTDAERHAAATRSATRGPDGS